MTKSYTIFASLLLTSLLTLNAWVYPEHREIALRAIQLMDITQRNQLQKLWSLARIGYEDRLSENIIDIIQTDEPDRLDFAAWPAIAGDHSCSPAEMLHTILESDWIINVAQVAAKFKANLAASKESKDYINAIREADINFQSVDPQYATRAGSNNAHFLLALKDVTEHLPQYVEECIHEGAELNAVGIYVKFHNSALKKAAMFHSKNLSQSERSQLALSIFADEAFALHFLEDVFAAGHVAGTWGNASQRKGTHDYYNERGLRTSTWNGKDIILTGDAYMRNEDAARAAEVIKISLLQLLDEFSKNSEALFSQDNDFTIMPDTFNVCQNNYEPRNNFQDNYLANVDKIISETPVPGLASGVGELPRFRAEIGMFGGFAPSAHGTLITSGFGINQDADGLIAGIEAAVRFGVGLDGVLNESGDGLAFVELGWRLDGSSTLGVVNNEGTRIYGALLSAVPGRSAYGARLRVPFYLIPGDLLIAGPILLLLSPSALTEVGTIAVNGGLIPWQSGIATSFGKFQLVLGREVGIYFYGRSKDRDAMYQWFKDEAGEITVGVISYRSTKIEFPILEYTPLRSYSMDQSSTLKMQFFAGIDIPSHYEDLLGKFEGVYDLELQTIWYFGVKLAFDWRYYF